jgi:hypothetical protein
LITLLLALAPSVASAQSVAGALNAGAIFDGAGDVGAGGWVDVWCAFDWARIGGFAGAATIPSSVDLYDRFAAPVGISLAAIANLGDYDLGLRARGGFWGGSTQQDKMTAGGFIGGAGFLEFHLGGGASLGAGVEIWGFFGSGQTYAVAPTLTLSWGPPPPEHTTTATPDYGGMAIPP